MRWLPQSLVIHRWSPAADSQKLVAIGSSREGKLRHFALPETVEAFQRMKTSAQAAQVGLHVIWAYRSPQLQQEQFQEAQQKYGKRRGILWLAPPGFSEHQTGWVLDIGDLNDPAGDDNPLFERTPAFHWLQENASKFQFELSFKPGNWQGVSYEPWHWRFVGTPEARRAFHPVGIRAFAVWTRSWIEAFRWWFHP